MFTFALFQMQLYCVSDVHFSRITCVEWSQNTLKLFSGDQEGCVACSEMDYGQVRANYRWLGQFLKNYIENLKQKKHGTKVTNQYDNQYVLFTLSNSF